MHTSSFDRFSGSKAKSRAVRKKTYARSSHMGGRVFVDMTVTFTESLIGNWFWIGVLDDHNRYSRSFFMKIKLQLSNKMEELFKNMTSLGTPVKYLRCDNAGEHQ